MSALASALLFVVLQLGPNQGLIYDQLARRDAIDRQMLPIAPLYEISQEPLYLVFHRQPDWRKAFYLPAGAPALPGERGLPGLEVPRLYLYKPYYLPQGGRLPDFGSLAVDTASAYFEALLERQFERRLGDAAFAARAQARADQLFAEVPESDRLAVYGGALAEFGGHLMSIANELSRAKRRGIQLCPGEKTPPLLAHWRRAFEAPFAGSYTPAGSFEAKLTEKTLEREDKNLAARELLGRSHWQGDPVADLGVCHP